jgi:hypothetical protein
MHRHILNALQRSGEALLCLDRSIALDPERADVWAAKAVALRAPGRLADAEEAERWAQALDGD